MNQYTQLTADGFPLYLNGNRHGVSPAHALIADTLIAAIEANMHDMLKAAGDDSDATLGL